MSVKIPWKTFETEKDGVKLEVTWWPHKFIAKYKAGDSILKYGRNIMAMCPMKYSEESLKNDFEKTGLYASFKEAGEIITTQQVFFEAKSAQFAIRKKEQEKEVDELNKQLRELKQKYKAGELTQSEYQNRQKPFNEKKMYIDLEHYHICKSIAEEITVIHEDARAIIKDYLEELWRKTND